MAAASVVGRSNFGSLVLLRFRIPICAYVYWVCARPVIFCFVRTYCFVPDCWFECWAAFYEPFLGALTKMPVCNISVSVSPVVAVVGLVAV